ncbi:hypothetical protein [Streptococcus oralis]|uniref:hypothetical protein n=1 Tax=Streptococcus oralis TaxID=1303 RepID=UPI000F68B951|nr:hypothetical protein [Streptococcus oralis]
MNLKANLTFSLIYHFFKWNFLFQAIKKPPDWVTSLGDYDEKEKFGISLNKGYSMKIEIRLGR